jgi:hypothetical protein
MPVAFAAQGWTGAVISAEAEEWQTHEQQHPRPQRKYAPANEVIGHVLKTWNIIFYNFSKLSVHYLVFLVTFRLNSFERIIMQYVNNMEDYWWIKYSSTRLIVCISYGNIKFRKQFILNSMLKCCPSRTIIFSTYFHSCVFFVNRFETLAKRLLFLTRIPLVAAVFPVA